MTQGHSLIAGLALGLGLAASAGLPAIAQEPYTLSDELTKALDQAVDAIKQEATERGADPGEALFAATRHIEESLFPEMWAGIDVVPAGPPLAIVHVFEGTDILQEQLIIPGPGSTKTDNPTTGVGTLFPQFLLLQLSPGSTCVWRTLSTGDRVKICR